MKDMAAFEENAVLGEFELGEADGAFVDTDADAGEFLFDLAFAGDAATVAFDQAD